MNPPPPLAYCVWDKERERERERDPGGGGGGGGGGEVVTSHLVTDIPESTLQTTDNGGGTTLCKKI